MKLLISACVLFCFVTARSQDLIVTAKGDSLNCKIIKIKPDYIHFTVRHENKIKRTLLPRGQIKIYRQHFYPIADVPIKRIIDIDSNYQKVRIGFFGGWSYRTAKTSPDIPSHLHQYVRELRSGLHFGGDFNYFFSQNTGLGLRYSIYRASNEMSNVPLPHGRGRLKDDITIQYVGPVLSTSFGASQNKPRFVSNFSLGYLSYKNEATAINYFTLRGETLGLLCDFGVVVPIDKDVSIDFMFGLTTGTLELERKSPFGGTSINREGLARIDFSIGINF
jgi:hypothetical protein